MSRQSELVSIQKREILVKVKKREDYNPPDHHRDRQEYMEVFRGPQSDRDAEIGQKGRLWMGTSYSSKDLVFI